MKTPLGSNFNQGSFKGLDAEIEGVIFGVLA
jgi:hypothetical protein